jgi:hypothetical protein
MTVQNRVLAFPLRIAGRRCAWAFALFERNVTFRWRDSAHGNKKRLMSRFYTCQLCGTNSFDYPVELQRQARELASRPAEWTPWNYRETLAQTVSLLDSADYDESLMAGKGRL